MPGKVLALLVEDGQEVQAGQGVLIVEAMKMENEMKAPRAGTVRKLCVQAGEPVESGAALFILE
jgi:pyruvate carboxylase subunit B